MTQPAKAKRGIPAKSDFNEWYPFMVETAELVDKRYPIKGMDVWRPYGWKTMSLIDDVTHGEMERTEHEEVRFPLLIPENLLEKENTLVARLQRAREEGVNPDDLRDEEEEAGFKKEVYWVKHAGENDLVVPMFLRPTSETAIYTLFPLWIRSHADLPMKIYQIVNTFRYETKQTRSFIRVREIHFFEAHTAHIDEDSASRQIDEDLEIVSRIMDVLCLPVLMAKRPVWDTFPGAWYTIGIDVVMPNGRTLQVASCHHYRDQWAKSFDIKYEDENGEFEYCHQTTYGMSERLLGAVVGMHGDDSGLIIPPRIAPIQIIVIPVLKKGSEQLVMDEARGILAELKDAGIRCRIDERDLRPGQKYYDWEIKGVPLRLELGTRDIENSSVFAAKRTGGKTPLPRDDIITSVKSQLVEVEEELKSRASIHMEGRVKPLPALIQYETGWSLEEEIEEGIVHEIAFDGSDADAEVVERTTGLSFLGDAVNQFTEDRPCAVTGKPTRRKVWLARTY